MRQQDQQEPVQWQPLLPTDNAATRHSKTASAIKKGVIVPHPINEEPHNLQWRYQQFASWFSRYFSTQWNPLYHLGEISIFMFTIACISGIYLFLFYTVDPTQAYNSTEELTHQWVGGIMRSLHRYSSDALVVFVALHFLQTLIMGKFRRVLAWISGFVALIVTGIIGLTGYLLVWDQKAKLLGLLTAKLLSALAIFEQTIASAFVLNDLQYLGGFFRVSLFAHIFLSFAIVFVLWIHVMRIAKPKIFPSREIMIMSTASLVFVCIAFPALSDLPAQGTILPLDARFDWFYFFGYFPMVFVSPLATWVIWGALLLTLALLPVFFRKKEVYPAYVDWNKCDGCLQCYLDCPYGAISMVGPENDKKALVDEDRCVGCGICVASCKDFGVDIATKPDLSQIRVKTHSSELYTLESQQTQKKLDAVIFRCQFIPRSEIPESDTVHVFTVPCIGNVHAETVGDMLRDHAEGVALVACEDCFFRFGNQWTEKRFARTRRPLFNRKTAPARVRLVKASVGKHSSRAEIKTFIESLSGVDDSATKGKIGVSEFGKIRYVAAAALIFLGSFTLPWLSTSKISFYPEAQGTLIISLKYTSSSLTTSARSGASDLSHMQAPVQISSRRSPLRVEVRSATDGKEIYSEILRPRGFREDLAIVAYKEITLAPGAVHITLSETEAPEKTYRVQNAQIKAHGGLVVSFMGDALKVQEKGN